MWDGENGHRLVADGGDGDDGEGDGDDNDDNNNDDNIKLIRDSPYRQRLRIAGEGKQTPSGC